MDACKAIYVMMIFVALFMIEDRLKSSYVHVMIHRSYLVPFTTSKVLQGRRREDPGSAWG